MFQLLESSFNKKSFLHIPVASNSSTRGAHILSRASWSLSLSLSFSLSPIFLSFFPDTQVFSFFLDKSNISIPILLKPFTLRSKGLGECQRSWNGQVHSLSVYEFSDLHCIVYFLAESYFPNFQLSFALNQSF